MILKNKKFVLPALLSLGNLANSAMIGGTAISIKQGRDQEKMQKQANEEQAAANENMLREQREAAKKQQELLAQQNKKLEKISQKVNPQSMGQLQGTMQQSQQSILDQPVTSAYSETEREKNFVNAGSVLNNLKQLGKDVYHTAWKAAPDASEAMKETVRGRRNFMIGGAVTGATMGLVGYGINKAVSSDAKKNGMLPGQQPVQQTYSVGSVLDKTKKGLSGMNLKSGIGWGVVLGGLMAAPTAMTYLNEKKQRQQQMAAAQQPQQPQLQQRSYGSIGSILSGAKSFIKNKKLPGLITVQGVKNPTVGDAWNSFNKHKFQSAASWWSNNVAFGGGATGAQNFAKDLATNSKGTYGKKIGTWFADPNHRTAATLASIPIGMGIMGATWDGGEKAVNKVVNTVDPHAYDYQNSKEQRLQ